MTRENAKKLLPIITAYAEGKAIEFRDKENNWLDIDKEGCTPEFSAGPSRYRIKTTPREAWMIQNKFGNLVLGLGFSSFEAAKQYAIQHYPQHTGVIKLVETPTT